MKCIVKGCKSNSSKLRNPNVRNGYTFHRFPRNSQLATVWKQRLNLGEFNVLHINNIVCSLHFHPQDVIRRRNKYNRGFKCFLDTGAVPLQQPIVEELEETERIPDDSGVEEGETHHLIAEDEINIEIEEEEEFVNDTDDPILIESKSQSKPLSARSLNGCSVGCSLCSNIDTAPCATVQKLLKQLRATTAQNEVLKEKVTKMTKKIKSLRQNVGRKTHKIERMRKENALERAIDVLPETSKHPMLREC